jgi:large subunit ribosomal protein L25
MKIIDIELKNRVGKKDNYYIPAILYGRGLKESYPCMVNRKEFIQIIKSNSRNAVFNCKLEDGRVFPTLIKEIQKDVIDFEPIHIDFFAITLKEKIQMSVPIHPIGESKGAKKGGILEQATFKLDLKGEPTRIPDRLDIDVSDLDIGDSIHAGEIELPEEIELITPLDAPIFTVVPPKVEEVAPAPAAAGASTEETAPSTAAKTETP